MSANSVIRTLNVHGLIGSSIFWLVIVYGTTNWEKLVVAGTNEMSKLISYVSAEFQLRFPDYDNLTTPVLARDNVVIELLPPKVI